MKIKTSFFPQVKSFFKVYHKALLSGLLIGLSFIPFPFFTLFFALVPLWLFLYEQKSLKRVIIGGMLCQFLATLIGLHWVLFTFHDFGNMNWFVSSILLLLFCCFVHFYICISGLCWFLITKKSSHPLPAIAKLLLFPLIFSLLHSLIPMIFPWNMGYPWLWGGMWGAQTAELWGFRFLNTLCYIFNLFFLILYKHRFDSTGKKALAGAVLLFVFLNGLGFYLKKRLPQPDESLNAIVIQNNIGSVSHSKHKMSAKKAFRISKYMTYKSILKYAKRLDKRKNIDFVLWSEGSYPYPISKYKNKEHRLSTLVKAAKIPLITGGLSKDKKKYGVALFVIDRNGDILKPIYNKVKLLVFGEYFPGIQTFPFLRKLFPYFGSNLTPGKSVQVHDLEGARLGWQICYEILFDKFSRELANKEAQILVNITNDSWYDSWQEPWQHLTASFARAIEIRRPLLRSTNTGRSGLIHLDGTVDKISPMDKPWSHLYKIPYYKNPPKTLFMSWGYYINEMFLFFLVLLIGFFIFKQNVNEKTNQ